MVSRSACPTAPMTASISLPVAVPVSSGWRPTCQHPQRYLLGFEPSDDLQQVADRPRQPVELGDDESIFLPAKIESQFKLVALRHRGDLLAENLLASGGPKLPLLGLQTGVLSDGDVVRSRPAWRFLSHMEL